LKGLVPTLFSTMLIKVVQFLRSEKKPGDFAKNTKEPGKIARKVKKPGKLVKNLRKMRTNPESL